MKHSIILLLLLSTLKFSYAQRGLITLSTQSNSDNTVSIYAESQAMVPYTVKVNFSVLTGYTTNVNLNSNVALVTTEYGRKEIIKLARIPMMTYDLQYKYNYYPGIALRKAPDSNFSYLIPANAGNQARCYQVSSIADKLGITTDVEYHGMGFIYKLYDTVCASRAGIVYEVIDTVAEGEKKTTFFRSGRNKIALEHRDGSLVNYTFLAPIRLLVAPGNEVLPGQPLAVFNKESEKYYVSMATFYLDQKKVLKDDGYSSYNYLPLHYYNGESDPSAILIPGKYYDVQHSPAVIAAELSKKEKKKLGF